MNRFNIPELERFVFPYAAIPKQTRLLIYGGGIVGCTYIESVKDNKDYNLLGLVDKKPISNSCFGLKVIMPHQILEIYGDEYDMILIAIERQEIAVAIWQELKELGISKSKLKWIDPTRGIVNGLSYPSF